MKLNLSKAINYKLISVIWVSIWLIFSVRGFFLTDYRIFKNSLGKNAKQKKQYLMPAGLYDFIEFCRKTIPEKDDFVFVYNTKELDPTEKQRVVYYLYPRKIRADGPYIMVFGLREYKRRGFELLSRFNESSFILRKAD